MSLLGIEIGGTKLQIVVGDDAGRIIHRWRSPAERAGGGPAIARQIEQGLKPLLEQFRPRAVGVGFGGPIDTRTGRICRSHQIEGWENFALRDWLRGLAGVPVAVDNDANTACLGEAVHGAGRGADPMFYANFGSGVGGGLVSGGAIYHGVPPGEVEFGHLRLDRSGATVESRCSGWAVDRRIRQLRDSGANGTLTRSIGDTPGGEARHLSAALAAGDPDARAVLDELADDLAFALSHAVHLFHPAAIVLGGGLSLVGEPLRQAIESALPRFVMEAFLPGPPVRLTGLGEDSVPVGALVLASRAVSELPR